MSSKVSILSVVVVIAVTVMATVAVAFAAQDEEGGNGQEEEEGGNGQAKVTLCHNISHNPHTITVGEPAVDAHLAHGDTLGACAGAAPKPPEGTTLTTQATTDVTLGAPISDTATLSGATSDAGGEITFHLYPSLDDCQAATNEIDTGLEPVAVNGNGDYPSGEFTPDAAGTYYWTASYNGDTNNDPADELSCPENEASAVNGTTATEQNIAVAGEIGNAEKRAKGTKDSDITNGTDQSDKIAGGAGRDVIRGHFGDDRLSGDQSVDKLYGDAGDDFLQGSFGADVMLGGLGNDNLNGADGKSRNDVVDGGGGIDHCVGDEGDTFRNCDGNVVVVTVPPEVSAPTEAGN